MNKMPKYDEHLEISKKLFGEDGAKFHKWLDQYSCFGYRHRQVLHHIEGVDVGCLLFGEEARKHLEQHIRDDLDKDKIPKVNQVKNFPRTTDGLVEKK